MAHSLAMARSFYSWMAKIEMNESPEFVAERLPKEYPTDPHGALRTAEQLCESLQETDYCERAEYWKGIFESFVQTEPLDESYLRSLVDFLKKWFVPPAARLGELPGDNIILRTVRTAHDKLGTLWNKHIETRRQQFPTYSILRDYFEGHELETMGKALRLPSGIPDFDQLSSENKQRWAWKWRCFLFGTVAAFYPPRYLETMASGAATGAEYTAAFGGLALTGAKAGITSSFQMVLTMLLAILAYGVKIVWGEAQARAIFK